MTTPFDTRDELIRDNLRHYREAERLRVGLAAIIERWELDGATDHRLIGDLRRLLLLSSTTCPHGVPATNGVTDRYCPECPGDS